MRVLREVFPGRLRKVWNSMELRVLVLLSLFLQIVLISTGSRRKYIRKKWVGVILWLCYLSADVVATIALGVLSQAAGDDGDEKSVDQHSYAIMGFWAPFLLMHLGGPDSITAYALADNELWSRHFLGLIGQVFIAIYVLLRSWITTPINYLWFVIFAAGLIKYGERTWVLFSASRDQFRKGMVSPPDAGPNYAKLMNEFFSKEREGFEVSLEKVIDIAPSSTPTDPPKPDVAQGITDDTNLVRDIAPSSTPTDPPKPDVAQGITDDTNLMRDISPSSTPTDPPKPDVAQGITDDTNLVRDAYPFFQTFKQLFADLILSFQDKETSLSFFRAQSWDRAFGMVEVELGLIYDLFYTKASLLKSSEGFTFRYCSFVFTVAAFVAFAVIDKSAYPETEVIITYILLVGAILIEIYAVVIYLRSDWKVIITLNLERMPRPDDRKLKEHIPPWLSYLLPARLRWSNAMGQYNVLGSFFESNPGIIRRTLKKYLFWNGKSVPDSLKVLIFDELKRRVSRNDEHKLGGYRGDKILLQEIARIKKIDEVEVDPGVDEVEFDQSVLLWHMATDFCYLSEVDQNNKPAETWLYEESCAQDILKWLYEESCAQDILKFRREMSVLLSNYMVHLLITSPFMLPSGIGQIRFQDTRAEAKEFFDGRKNISRSEACKRLLKVDSTRLAPSKVKGDRSKSLLFDACRLAKSLQSLEVGERWKKITQAWLHILTFAAAQCEWNDHAEKLSQGGELLTHVWLLMAHFGMTDHFQISQGYQRVKLDLK